MVSLFQGRSYRDRLHVRIAGGFAAPQQIFQAGKIDQKS
tara:strand:- start:1195 stop:1311 length:117 start_codon:yes stop_codon:yes gene_type:complete